MYIYIHTHTSKAERSPHRMRMPISNIKIPLVRLNSYIYKYLSPYIYILCISRCRYLSLNIYLDIHICMYVCIDR